MRKQTLATVISTLLALGLVAAAQAVAQPVGAINGFYGGVSVRDRGGDMQGLTFGASPVFATRFNSPTADDNGARASLLFGGYRFGNDLSVEASFGSIDKYALRPTDTSMPHGVGLNLFGATRSLSDLSSRSWNLDVMTSWSFLRTWSLYGRLGYAQNDASPFGSTAINLADPRRVREGVNYGVGLRYDVSPSLGLKVEYARFGRFAGEFSSPIPESDQVSVGLQLRF